MSSAAVTTADRHTFWCHECDMSVTLLCPSSSSSSSSSSPLLCPHCLTDYLEHMDFTIHTSSSLISDHPLSSSPPPGSDPSSSFVIVDPLPATSDDNYLLNSPQFLRLFQHLGDSDSDSDFAPSAFTPFTPIKPSVLAIPTIKVSSTMLEEDPVLICAICKDHFILEVEAKQLPCSHLYHPDCILPWLSNHDSCPLCRFKLPSDDSCDREKCRGATMALLRARDLMHHDSYGLGTTLRHIARRHNSIFSEGNQVDSSRSPNQLRVSEIGNGELIDSGEIVSSVANDGVIVIVNSSGDENELVGMDGSIDEEGAGTVV